MYGQGTLHRGDARYAVIGKGNNESDSEPSRNKEDAPRTIPVCVTCARTSTLDSTVKLSARTVTEIDSRDV